jgi:hypothetical protein
MKKITSLLISFLILAFLISTTVTVRADTGPKPGMSFEFTQEFSGDPVTINSGTLYECESSDCQDATPLMQAGPQHFSCEAATCSALAYGFSTYHQLEIVFSDGVTRRSNIFENHYFYSSFTVSIRQDDLLVKAKGGMTPILETISGVTAYPGGTIAIICGSCLVGIIIIIVVIILLVRRANKKK